MKSKIYTLLLSYAHQNLYIDIMQQKSLRSLFSSPAMANTPSISVEVSPKLELSIDHSIMHEVQPHDTRELFINVDETPSIFQKIVAELFGTYIFVFTGCGAILVDKIQNLTIVGIAIVWGLAVIALVYSLGHVSGAHFNPAVTIALAAARKFPWKHVPTYVVTQCIGSTLASITLRVLFNDQDNIRATVTQYSGSTTDLEAIIWEFIISFMLMFTICGVATDNRSTKDMSGVAIGAIFCLNVTIAGPITGASMNPARSLGPAVVSNVYKNIWVFIVAPILGTMAATLVYSVLRLHKPQQPECIKSTYNDIYSYPDFRRTYPDNHSSMPHRVQI